MKKIIIIEAKAISKSINYYVVKAQLDGYIENNFKKIFKGIPENNIIKILLTKYEHLHKENNVISINWNEILIALYRKTINTFEDELCMDYFKFLTKINGTMKFYEKEVLSIPSANWSQKLIKEYNIYECLNEGKYIIKKKPLYITFRKAGGGEMEILFKIEDIIILRPQSDLHLFLESDYPEEIKQSILGYCNFMTLDNDGHWKNGLPNDERQFIILSKNDNIKLNAPFPKPTRNNSYRAYYTLSQIINKKIE